MVTAETSSAEPRLLGHLFRGLSEFPVLWISLSLFLAVLPARPEIASAANFELLLLSTSLLAVLAIGQLFVLITAGIDLSLPAVMALASVLGTAVLTALTPSVGPWPAVVVAVAVMLGVGVAVGLLQGLAVAVLSMPAFLVTLSSLIGISGLAVWWTQSERSAVTPQFVEIWYARPAGVPLPLVWIGLLAVVAHFWLAHTITGCRLYALGHNPATSRISGVPVLRVTVFAYAMCGFCAAVASVLYTARLYTGSPQLVENEVLLDCIGAAVIGGTSLFGGRGRVSGTLLGAFFMALLGNSLNMLGLRYWHVIMVKGGVILLAATLDVLRTGMRTGK
jgi:ribose/xylose/arabinose/galactoside ABC-type transport system permease subunit